MHPFDNSILSFPRSAWERRPALRVEYRVLCGSPRGQTRMPSSELGLEREVGRRYYPAVMLTSVKATDLPKNSTPPGKSSELLLV